MAASRLEVRLTTLHLPDGPTADPGTGPNCPVCRDEIEWSQPDSTRPDRLLGICRGCSAWAILLTEQEEGAATLILLDQLDKLAGDESPPAKAPKRSKSRGLRPEGS